MEGVIGAPCSVRTTVKRRKGITHRATSYVSHINVIYITGSPRTLLVGNRHVQPPRSGSHGNHHLIDTHFKFVLLGSKTAKRKYDPGYLKCGFWLIEDNKGQKPQVLANESMKPSKLKHHLETKHPACQDKLVERLEFSNLLGLNSIQAGHDWSQSETS